MLIYWVNDTSATAVGSDLTCEYMHGGIGSRAATNTLRMINTEEAARKVMGMSGWRRCLMYHDIMAKVLLEDRCPDLKSDGEGLVRVMQEDDVIYEHMRSDRQTAR